MEGAWESTNAEKLRVLSTSKKVSWEAFQAFLSSAYISSADNSVSQLLCPLQSRVRTSDRTPCSARVRQVEGRRPRRQGHDTHAQRTHHRLLPRESAIAKAFSLSSLLPALTSAQATEDEHDVSVCLVLPAELAAPAGSKYLELPAGTSSPLSARLMPLCLRLCLAPILSSPRPRDSSNVQWLLRPCH